jgi:hypothetical protein
VADGAVVTDDDSVAGASGLADGAGAAPPTEPQPAVTARPNISRTRIPRIAASAGAPTARHAIGRIFSLGPR